MRNYSDLVELLQRVFDSPEQRRRFLEETSLDKATTARLAQARAPEVFSYEAVDELHRRGQINAAFFDRLLEALPNDADRVKQVASEWLVDEDEWTAPPPPYGSETVHTGAASVMVWYARQDYAFFEELAAHLALLQRKGIIDVWHEGRIRAGDRWREEITSHIAQADIIILLVSPDLLSSGFIWDTEYPTLLSRMERGEVTVFPVIVRPCAWRQSPLASLNVLERSRPVSTSSSPDLVWVRLTKYVEEAAKGSRGLQ